MTRHVFVSVAAQHENLGDAIIRREVVRWVDTEGMRLHVLVADMPTPYLDVIGLPPDAVTYRSTGAWTRALAAHAVRGTGALVLAPGPQFMQATPHLVVHQVADTLALALLRVRRCPTAKLGRSMRPGFAPLTWLERLQQRWLLDVEWARDEASLVVTGPHGSVAPDIAFGIEPGPANDQATGHRTVMALGPRRADTWTPEVIERWLATAAALGLEPVMVTQVQFDEALHRDLARRHDLRHVSWGDTPHPAQLQAVCDIYDRAAVVVSDRLHALVLGATRGTLMRLPNGPDDKITPALHTIGLTVGDRLDVIDPAEVAGTMEAVAAARQRLEALRRRVTDVFGRDHT